MIARKPADECARAEHPRVRFAALVALVGVSIFVGGSAADARHRGRATGTGLATISYASAAPDFAFAAAGAQTRLSAFAGKPVVLNFWATWCEPCADELAAFARLRAAYGDDVVFIAISNEDAETTEPVLLAHGVDARAVADPDRKIFALYGLSGESPIPVTLVLGRDGKVGHVSIGELDWPELQAAVEQASALSPSPTPAPL